MSRQSEISPAYEALDPADSSTQKDKLIHQIRRKPILSQEITEQYHNLGPESPRNVASGFYGGYEWEPGFWRQFPYRGVLALIGSLFCMAGTIAILYRSDKQPVSNWKLSPTVYLALLTTATNLLLRFAFNQGVKISWWYSALRGATVQDLHYQWASGDGFWTALFAGRHFSLVSLASIATTLVVIDQPLIQRASTVVSTEVVYPINVTAPIAPEIPYGYTGYQIGRGAYQQVMSGPMISAFNDFNEKNPIQTDFAGCTDKCSGFVNAAGLAAQCTTISGPITYLLKLDNDYGGSSLPTSLFMAETAFGVQFTLAGTKSETNGSHILMEVAYTNNSKADTCTAIMTKKTCRLRPATLNYPVTLQGKTLSLGDIMGGSTVQSFQPPSNNSISIDGGSDFNRWTIGGLYLAATTLFSANGTYVWAGALANTMYLPDTLSNQFLLLPKGNNSADIYNLTRPTPCAANWADPTEHILTSLNEIAFRVSLLASGAEYRNSSMPPAAQVLPMLQRSSINVFHSEYKYLIGSSLLSAIFVLLVAPTFWGWWELGRPVSLNPIETAKAFDAPFFRGPGSNATAGEIVQHMAIRDLKYGEADSSGSGEISKRHLRLADPHEVSRPTPGTLYE